MQSVGPSTVLGDFANARFDYFGSTTSFLTVDGAPVVRTQNAGGVLEDYTIQWVFGIEPLQQYLVEFPGGRLQALPFAWDTRNESEGGQRWFHLYPDEEIAPGDALHWTGRQQNWNFMCAECHSTNLETNYDAASDSFATRWSELSVGCEACHGPGSVHVAEAQAGEFRNSRKGLVVNLDDAGRATWVMNLTTGIAERSETLMQAPQQPETCGRCHSRRGLVASEYEHGRPLLDTHRIALLDVGLYHADGQIDDEVYVYGSFLQSRMYRAGVSCSDCHNPHSLELRTGPDPNAVCGQCHLPTKFAAVEHSQHNSGDAACVDCHMPTKTYMGVDPRRDHGFRVPRPAVSAKTGSPDVCTGCHEDRDPGWAAAQLLEWFGEDRRPEFATAIHAGRTGGGNAALVAAFDDSTTPGIARATMLTLLAPPLGEAEGDVLLRGLADPDPLVRMAALRLHRDAPPDFRLQAGTELLADPVLAVRTEAAMAYAELRDYLSGPASTSFLAAAAEFEAAHRQQLNRPESHVALGDFAVRQGAGGSGTEHYRNALAMQPDLVLARVNYADALRILGDEQLAREVLEEGIRLTPGEATLHHSLGLLFVRIGENQSALHELRESVRLAPDNRRYAYVLEVALSEFGDAVPD